MREFVDFKTYNAHNPFGQYNPMYYVNTHKHPGSDFAVKVGTPIVAPCDGEMFKTEVSGPKGNVGIFVFTWTGGS